MEANTQAQVEVEEEKQRGLLLLQSAHKLQRAEARLWASEEGESDSHSGIQSGRPT